ncbi:MAG: SDR family NAD(P)-dependent oxidoreductase [Solirubrobacterales bacterium]|nr:SDR family NAD(P)-dependent oxidoreductase [Solirubrobacterales bacterium]
MSESLKGTVALVTGASSGIGEATARSLAAQGAKVALVARRVERIEKLAQEIAGHGHTALAIEGDVTDQEQAIAAVERTVSDFDRLDIIVNNAGVMLLGPMKDAPTDEWDNMIDVNLKGMLYVTHAALPHLHQAAESSDRKVADIVNISSVAGRVPNAGAAVYNLTKHGVGAMSEALRQEVSRDHVRMTIIEPGAVSTELVDHNRDGVREQVQKRFDSMTRLEAHDIADAIEYAVTRPAHVSINEILIRPTEQP